MVAGDCMSWPGSMQAEFTAGREEFMQAIAQHHGRARGCAVGAAAIAATTTVVLVAVTLVCMCYVLRMAAMHPRVHHVLTVNGRRDH